MAQLIISTSFGERRFALEKRICTVGSSSSHDFVAPSDTPGLLFTLSRAETGYEILPGEIRLRLNGSTVHKRCNLRSCDRLEWAGGTAVFLTSEVPVVSNPSTTSSNAPQVRPLAVLHNLAQVLQGPESFPSALHQALDALVGMANAETGFLLTETGEKKGWQMIASRQADDQTQEITRSELFSNTILNEALRKREPVYIENIVGHPWGDVASVIQARIFSAACFPLCLGEQVLGAVLLLTRTPGRSIKREYLGELGLLATQAALLLGLQNELRSTRQENARLKSLISETEVGLSETSPSLAELAQRIRKLASTPLSVLILGETGTGKELAARELHSASDRSRGPFVAINCAAIPATLLESTLFGYERGAFTGAVKAQSGRFVEADGGTLFLDEIGDLSLELQAKILRVLQERTVEPLGGRSVPINVRIVAATHRELDTLVRQGSFRQDLYFRLNGAQVKLPPLRERSSDISKLAEHFLQKSGSNAQLSTDAMKLLEGHSWPGNVRELEQVIMRAGLLSEGPVIRSADLELDFVANSRSEKSFESLEEAQSAFTREYVEKVLLKSHGNRSTAASKLGISERTLYRILAELS